MEKIKERKFIMLWLPKVLAFAALIFCALFFILMFYTELYEFCIIMAMFFGILACGFMLFSKVYELYFYYQLSLDINAVCQGDGVENKSYLFVIALDSATFGIYAKYWKYKIAQRLQANSPRYGFKMIIGGKEMLVLDLFSMGWISSWEFVRNMNRIAKVYNATGLPEISGGVEQ